MSKRTLIWLAIALFFLTMAIGVAHGECFDSAHRELRHNFNFIDSYEREALSIDNYATIIFNDNTGVAFLIEQDDRVVRVTVFAKAGNPEAIESALSFNVRELNGGVKNIVSIGMAPMRGIRILTTI